METSQKLYIVVSHQNNRDSTVISYALILVTQNPREAVKIARKTLKDQDQNAFISNIIIFESMPGEVHTLSSYKPGRELNGPVVYVGWNKDNETLVEKFSEEFKIYNRRKIEKAEQKASPGKFRAVVMYDSDLTMQIDEDTDRESAHWLCIDAVGESGLMFQVFDDQGEPQCEKNGQLKKLEIV